MWINPACCTITIFVRIRMMTFVKRETWNVRRFPLTFYVSRFRWRFWERNAKEAGVRLLTDWVIAQEFETYRISTWYSIWLTLANWVIRFLWERLDRFGGLIHLKLLCDFVNALNRSQFCFLHFKFANFVKQLIFLLLKVLTHLPGNLILVWRKPRTSPKNEDIQRKDYISQRMKFFRLAHFLMFHHAIMQELWKN